MDLVDLSGGTEIISYQNLVVLLRGEQVGDPQSSSRVGQIFPVDFGLTVVTSSSGAIAAKAPGRFSAKSPLRSTASRSHQIGVERGRPRSSGRRRPL